MIDVERLDEHVLRSRTTHTALPAPKTRPAPLSLSGPAYPREKEADRNRSWMHGKMCLSRTKSFIHDLASSFIFECRQYHWFIYNVIDMISTICHIHQGNVDHEPNHRCD